CQFSFAALCRDGRPLASVVARRTRQWPRDFGRASTYVETIDAPEVEEVARAVLAALRFAGLVEVEFKRDPRDGRLKLLDINPRAWGWHTLGARAGVDFAYLLWRMLNGEDVPELRGRRRDVTVLAIDDPRWSDFVGAQSDATIFHHPVWAKLLADSYGYRAMAVALSDGGALVAGLPVVDVSLPLGRRRWVSLPFTDHCPPLAGVRGAELAGALSEVARSSRLDRLEIRAPLGEEHGIQSHAPFVLHQVAVTGDVAATWKGLRRNHRRSVADAEEAGVPVVRGESAA